MAYSGVGTTKKSIFEEVVEQLHQFVVGHDKTLFIFPPIVVVVIHGCCPVEIDADAGIVEFIFKDHSHPAHMECAGDNGNVVDAMALTPG